MNHGVREPRLLHTQEVRRSIIVDIGPTRSLHTKSLLIHFSRECKLAAWCGAIDQYHDALLDRASERAHRCNILCQDTTAASSTAMIG